MERRVFIKTTAITVPILNLFPADLSAIYRETANGKLEKRSLGKTGEMLSVIGFGGIVVMNATPEEAVMIKEKALNWDPLFTYTG